LYIAVDYYGGGCVGYGSINTMRLIRMWNVPIVIKSSEAQLEGHIRALVFDIEKFDDIFVAYPDLSSDSIMLLINVVNNDKN
jgi:hypothetical protein